MGQPCPPKWSWPQIVMSFVPHTIDAVQTSLLRSPGLAPHVAYRKACSREALQPLLICVKKYKSLSMGACQSCFSSIDAVNLKTCSLDNTSAWCNHPSVPSGVTICAHFNMFPPRRKRAACTKREFFQCTHSNKSPQKLGACVQGW